jgi:hypothetical protein
MKFKISIKKSRTWIPALGMVVGYGFLHNCAIAPLTGCRTVEWTNLILTLSILIGLGGARDIVLRKFSYIGQVVEEAPKSLLRNKIWIPFVGWCLVFGFANNMILVPHISAVGTVEWSGLLSTLSILLTVSGVRDYGIYAQDRKQQQGTEANERIE